MFGREPDQCLCLLLDCLPLLSLLTDSEGSNRSLSQAKGMRQFPGQGERFLTPLERLVRIAQGSQGPGRIAQAGHPWVLAGAGGMEMAPLGVIEGHGLLQVGSGLGQLSKSEQGDPQRLVSA